MATYHCPTAIRSKIHGDITPSPAACITRRDEVGDLDPRRLAGLNLDDAAGTAYRNWSDGAAWVNQETAATFDATASNRTISIINPVIAHQLIFNASGYSLNNYSNGALTVTAGGIQANQSVTINVPVTVGGPADVDHRQRHDAERHRRCCIPSSAI